MQSAYLFWFGFFWGVCLGFFCLSVCLFVLWESCFLKGGEGFKREFMKPRFQKSDALRMVARRK